MKRARPDLVLYLALIGLPAILLGVCGARLLWVERQRLAETRTESRRAVARQFALRITQTARDAEAEAMRLLRAIPETDRPASLRRLAETEPLVRNAFLWKRGEGLVCPDARSATEEERAFIRRYAPLFAPRAAWGDVPEETSGADAPSSPPRAGWRPWFAADQLFLVGWLAVSETEVVGVELETVALLARLADAFAESHGETGLRFRLLDGQGRVVLGAVPEEASLPSRTPPPAQPADTLSLAPALPHWTLVCADTAPPPGAGGMLALGACLLALLVASVCGGGILLARDARAQRLDALRKTTFVSNVSHELRTPLTSIRMYAELLAEGRAADPAQADRFLRIIVEECKRLSGLVANVLDFNLLGQGRKRYRLERLDLAACVAETVAGMEEKLNADGFVCTLIAPAADGLGVRADRDALRQVLLNVLDNAAKYASGTRAIEVSVSREEGRGNVHVADRGPGIDPAHAPRIFEAFYRVDTRVTAAVNGCGLGLSIARGLMRGMGGDLTYTPRAGGGSVFTLTLPLDIHTEAP
jgi:signal transduction histidine kinase